MPAALPASLVPCTAYAPTRVRAGLTIPAEPTHTRAWQRNGWSQNGIPGLLVLDPTILTTGALHCAPRLRGNILGSETGCEESGKGWSAVHFSRLTAHKVWGGWGALRQQLWERRVPFPLAPGEVPMLVQPGLGLLTQEAGFAPRPAPRAGQGHPQDPGRGDSGDEGRARQWGPPWAASPSISGISLVLSTPPPNPSHKPCLFPLPPPTPIPGFALCCCPCCFPHWGHSPFPPRHLYFTLDGGSAGVPNPSQSYLMTQPTAAREGLSKLLPRRPCSLGERVLGVYQDHPRTTPRPAATSASFQGHTWPPQSLQTWRVFELSPSILPTKV